jgi:transcription antitermination factor NusG
MRSSLYETPRLSEVGEALQEANQCRDERHATVPAQNSGAYWYAVQTYPRHEKRVHEDLKLRSLESFLPLYETVHRWKNGCKARVELPLFPGYLFVKIDPRERFKVLSLPGAVSIVGSPSGPWPLPEADIATLRTSMQLHKFEPHAYLAVGQEVRIKSGPLANTTGFLVRESEGFRVVLSVEMIRQSAAVEVDADNVEPIGAAPTGFDT